MMAAQAGRAVDRSERKEDRMTEHQPKSDDQSVKKLLANALPSIRQVTGKLIDPERLVKIVLVARARTPKLAECSPESLLMSVMHAAEVGLEPNTPLQHAALVPFKNRHTNRQECQFMPMWRGLVYLAKKSAGLVTCKPRVVYSRDRYKLDEGVDDQLVHEPHIGGDRGDPVFAYSVVRLREGEQIIKDWDWLPLSRIKEIQARARSQEGPWTTDWDEMARKTVLKHHMKLLPLADERLHRAMEIDDDDYSEQEAAANVLAFDLPKGLDSGDRGDELADKIVRGKRGKEVDDPQGTLVK
jgi:recombination protein RecT